MRIYLDNCVYQDLKREENQHLLSVIEADKERNIYCFSEAHLYDLSRDASTQKHDDMEFIEGIAENHCFYFKEKTRFEYLTPKQYYDSFDWSYTMSFDDLFSDEDPFMGMFKMMLKSLPFNLGELIPADQLPVDMPESFKDLLTKTVTFYDFFEAFMGFTEVLTTEQKKFRDFIKYLHKNSLLPNIYPAMGIEGYDGEKITDRDKLRNAYTNYFIKEGQKKSDYDLFIDLYNGLEMFGFVKGKPSKQKMMNLINDAKHAFFGAFCDIVISKDTDFLNKTKFMYDLFGINTIVLDITETETILKGLERQSELGIINMIEEIKRPDPEKRIIKVEDDDDTKTAYLYLPKIYFSYFDMLGLVTSKSGSYYFFTKEPANLSTGTLVKEIEYVTNRLFKELGKDANELGLFNLNEIVEGKWCGRTWRIEQIVIELNFNHKMHLAFYPMEYVENIFKNDKACV